MQFIKRSTLYCILCFGIFCILSTATIHAQSAKRNTEPAPENQQVLQSLLTEVRQLSRLAVPLTPSISLQIKVDDPAQCFLDEL